MPYLIKYKTINILKFMVYKAIPIGSCKVKTNKLPKIITNNILLLNQKSFDLYSQLFYVNLI